MWDPLELTTVFSPVVYCGLLCALFIGWRVLCPSKQARALSMLVRPHSTLPVIGNTLDVMVRHRHDFHDWILDESRRCEGRPWAFTLLGRPPTVVLTSSVAFEDVTRRQFDRFGKHSAAVAGDVFGDGIFAADGEQWHHQRKTASHLFSLRMMRESMEHVVREQATELCARLAAHCTEETSDASSEPINLKFTMDWYATNVFTRIGFGVDLRSLASQQHDEFFRAFTRLPMAIHRRSQQPAWLWQLKRGLSVGYEGQLKRDRQLVDGTIYEVISQSMSSKAATATSGTDSSGRLPDLISLFLEKLSVEKIGLDGDKKSESCRVETTPKLLRDMAFNFTAAGRGTTAQTLQWFVVMLNRYPDVEWNIRSELREKLPQLFEDGEPPTMNDVQQLTYLEAVIKESLRLNPVAPLIGRIATQDTVLSDGTHIAAGMRVVIPTFAAARLESIWGPDATEFKPERWLDPATGKLLAVSPYKFIVFLAGPRACLGAKLAMLELKIALACVLAKFHLHLLRDAFEIGYKGSLSLPLQGEVLSNVVPAPLNAAVMSTRLPQAQPS